jgi:hypothetical protein
LKAENSRLGCPVCFFSVEGFVEDGTQCRECMQKRSHGETGSQRDSGAMLALFMTTTVMGTYQVLQEFH